VLEPFNPLIFKRKTMEIIVPISVKLTPESQALIDALTAMGKAASAPTATAAQPAIGAPWRGGKYAGISVGEDGQPDGYIILLADKPDAKLTWQGSLDWAKTLVDARLPSVKQPCYTPTYQANLTHPTGIGPARLTQVQTLGCSSSTAAARATTSRAPSVCVEPSADFQLQHFDSLIL
jgi:hypothetical protein